MAQKVTQNQSEISVLEKEDVTLNCAYEANSYTYYLFWYKQPPSREMIFLIHQESYNELNTTKGQYFLNFQKATSSISLTISDLQLEDSAVYFCALRDHSDAAAWGSPTETSAVNMWSPPAMNSLVRFSVRTGEGRGVRSENLTVRKMLSLAQRAYFKVSFIKNTCIFNSLSCRRSFVKFFLNFKIVTLLKYEIWL